MQSCAQNPIHRELCAQFLVCSRARRGPTTALALLSSFFAPSEPMGSRKGSITHVQDTERLLQELKHCKIKEKQREILEELGEVALLPPGRESIMQHSGIGIITDAMASDDTAVRCAADETVRRVVVDERCRLAAIKKLVPLLKHHSMRTKLHALVAVANLAIESTLNRA